MMVGSDICLTLGDIMGSYRWLMGRLIYFWVDLDATCVDFDNMLSYSIWMKNYLQLVKPLNISAFL